MEFISESAEQTEHLGYEFAQKLKPQDVIFLIGDLGSGKTTFVKGLAKGFGIDSRILSPTFVVVRTHTLAPKNYQLKTRIRTLYHLDLYRLSDEKQVKDINFKDYLDDENAIVVIEWPQVGQNIVDKKIWQIEIDIISENRRSLNITHG